MVEALASDNLYVTDLPVDFDDLQLKKIFGAYGVITQSKVLGSPVPGQKKAALIRFASLEEAQWIVDNLHGNIPQGLTDPVSVRYADTPETKAAKMSGLYGKGGSKGAALVRPSPYGNLGKDGWGQDWGKGSWGKDGKGGAKGFSKGKGTTPMKVLYQGLLAANALPGGSGYTNDENALYIANLPADTTDLDLYKIFAPFGAIAPRGVRAMLNLDGTCKGIGFVNFMESTAAETAVLTLNGTEMPCGTVLTVKTKSPSVGGKGGVAA